MSRKAIGWSKSVNVEEPMVNLTPLIDVVFVILITFIVIAPLLELDRVELASSEFAPQDHSVSVQEKGPIAIYVQGDNSIWVNGHLMTLSSLQEYLRGAKKEYPNAKPQLFHDKKAHFGTYQSVKNVVESAGYQQMDVILKPA